MDATPSMHTTWRTSRTRRLITGAGITAALAASVLLPVPARAITTETAATLTETQKKVEETAAAFDEANKNLEELQAKITDNAVSYTHLDVYKRQSGTRCEPPTPWPLSFAPRLSPSGSSSKAVHLNV